MADICGIPSSPEDPSIVYQDDQENDSSVAASSPLQRTNNLKLRKPPTVTPKRFTRFFTPRSSLSGGRARQSKAGRQLRDITRNGINLRPTGYTGEEPEADWPSSRPTKRRKHSIDFTSSPPQSSPLKHIQVDPGHDVPVYQYDLDTPCLTDEEPELPELPELSAPPRLPPRIRRLKQQQTTLRLLSRSFGGHATSSRGYRGPDHGGRLDSSVANFCTTSSDTHTFRGDDKALPFCTASCNTNSLTSVGDEDGRVHMLDTAATARFDKSHLSFQVHHNAIIDMAFSSCDYILATASGDQTARIVDMQTQRTLCVLAGHRCTLKQIRFHPNDDKLLTTSGRDGLVNVWDLRCSKSSVQNLRIGHQLDADTYISPQNMYPYATMSAGPAHRMSSYRERIVKPDSHDIPWKEGGVSITSIEHLPGSRAHLLLSASEQNASLNLFDLRAAGRNTKNDKIGFEVPVSCTDIPEAHVRTRNYGISALAISGDGARAFSVCRDNTVYAYSTNHLIMGSAGEMIDAAKRTRITPPDRPKAGLDPLYGLRHPSLRVGSFYIKASLRPARGDQDELLAIGSQDNCAVVFPTDERGLRLHGDVINNPDGEDSHNLPGQSAANKRETQGHGGSRVFSNIGAALIRGHAKEVTSLAFAHGGELVTTSDDFRALCWREDMHKARELRSGGEGNGARWACGWADVDESGDDA